MVILEKPFSSFLYLFFTGTKTAENIQKNNNISCSPKLEKDTTSKKPEKQRDKITEDHEVLPGPRQSGNIKVEFTPRKLATPARESKLPEEELVIGFDLLHFTTLLFSTKQLTSVHSQNISVNSFEARLIFFF